ncbi:MAG: ribbon-helix-helix protein, CopG family [Acidobacteria bacterium]|nr:ribbon-helix-helix protein, CopG family [Acidobacteriota bacterium]
MSTTVHLPADLLAAIDRQAQGLGLSRNRYIVRALERAVATESRWSARLVDELAAAGADSEGRQALVELRAAIAANRSRKEPPAL